MSNATDGFSDRTEHRPDQGGSRAFHKGKLLWECDDDCPLDHDLHEVIEDQRGGERATCCDRQGAHVHTAEGVLTPPPKAPCSECGTEAVLGWAGTCRKCWDAFVTAVMTSVR